MELKFLSKTELPGKVWQFDFERPNAFTYEAGDYSEISIPDIGRRWLSLSSAPSEPKLSFITRNSGSKFKAALFALSPGESVLASPAIGTFNLPKAPKGSLIFVGGGLGIAPVRSIITEVKLSEIRFKSDLNLIYGAGDGEHLFLKEMKQPGLNITPLTRRVTIDDIKKVPDWQDSTIYLSGPEAMSIDLEQTLLALGVPRIQIKLCYFPGYQLF